MICHCLAKIRSGVRSGDNCSDNANLACAGMVPSPFRHFRDVLQTAILLPTPLNNLLLSPNQQPHPLVPQAGLPAIRGVDGYWQNLVADGVSEQSSKLLRSHSWRRGTAPGNSGVAGVVREKKMIYFAPLCPP